VCVKKSNASAKDVHVTSMEHLTQRWKSVLITKESLWKNNVNFVNDIPMKYTNFNITVIIVLDEKNIFNIFIPTFIIFVHT
jgi:hypothetical protein